MSCIAEFGKTCQQLLHFDGVTRFNKVFYHERRGFNNITAVEKDALFTDVLTAEAAGSVGGDQCELYLAKSSIPNGGFGAFAGIETKSFFESDSSEIVIPLIDIEKHFPSFQKTVLSNYLWRAHARGGQFESDKVDIMQPNLGMVSNGHLALYNINTQYDYFRQWTSISNRTQSPGSGAYSSFSGINFGTSTVVEQGNEIFLDYGPGYFYEREEETGELQHPYPTIYIFHFKMLNFHDITGMLFPSDVDHAEADKIVKDFLSRIEKGEDRDNIDLDYANTIEELSTKEATKRVAVALPNTTEELKEANESGTARYTLSGSRRSIPWLEENGFCLDNLRVGLSSISQAGKGAFATRSSDKHKVIAPVPLLPVSRETLNMYHFDESGKREDIYSHQLLLNYCFGHPNSSILLFPYSSKVQYINHNGNNPNARLRWSTSELNNLDMLDWPVKDLKAGLMLEVVAIRDINVGEEVTIDYGEEWEKAWVEHKKQWSMIEKTLEPNPTYATHALDMEGGIIRTMKEQESQPYPSCVRTACFSWINNGDFRYATKEFSTLRPCDVIRRVRKKDGSYRYNAKVHETEYFEGSIPDSAILTDIPREAMSFIVEPYCSDQHLLNAFRHEIGLPDDMYPEAWLDLN